MAPPPGYILPLRLRSTNEGRSVPSSLTLRSGAAFANKDIHALPIKSVEQQAISAIHRLRSAWIGTRTHSINTLRGLLREFGMLVPVGSDRVVGQVRTWLREKNPAIPEALRPLFASTCDEITELKERIVAAERQLREIVRKMPEVKRLRTVPGIGPLTAMRK